MHQVLSQAIDKTESNGTPQDAKTLCAESKGVLDDLLYTTETCLLSGEEQSHNIHFLRWYVRTVAQTALCLTGDPLPEPRLGLTKVLMVKASPSP